MNLTFEDLESGKRGHLTVDGELTVSRAEELRMFLIKALIDADQVNLDFGPVTETDLSCLQLLCSAHRSAARMNKKFSISAAWPDPFNNAVHDAGYARLKGCRFDVDNSCLWIKR